MEITEHDESKVSYLADYIHEVLLNALAENEIYNNDEMLMFGAALTNEWLSFVNEVMFTDPKDVAQYLKQVIDTQE